ARQSKAHALSLEIVRLLFGGDSGKTLALEGFLIDFVKTAPTIKLQNGQPLIHLSITPDQGPKHYKVFELLFENTNGTKSLVRGLFHDDPPTFRGVVQRSFGVYAAETAGTDGVMTQRAQTIEWEYLYDGTQL